MIIVLMYAVLPAGAHAQQAPPALGQSPSVWVYSLYKTITYTVVVLTTDQLWYRARRSGGDRRR